MPNLSFVVDRKLGAVRLDRLLDVRHQLREEGTVEQETAVTEDRPVLTSKQTLEPNKLYPSSGNKAVQYYLPKYRVAVDEEQRPAVELRHIDSQAEEVGRLTLTLTWDPPSADQRFELRTIDHIVNLSLQYRIPVDTDSSDAPPSSDQGWEQSIPLQPAQQLGGQLARSTTVFTDVAQFNAVYQAMSNPQSGTTLEIHITAKAGVQTWRQVVVGRMTERDQARTMRKRNALFTNMIRKENLTTLKRDSRTSGRGRVNLKAQPTQPTATPTTPRRATAQPAAVRGIATPAISRAALLSARSRTTARTPRAATSATARSVARATPSVTARSATRATPSATAKPASKPKLDTDAIFSALAATAVSQILKPTGASTATDTGATATVPAVAAADPLKATLFNTAATLLRVNTPVLAEAVADSDLKIAGKKAVPMQVALDSSKQPAVIDTDLEYETNLAFVFDPGDPANQNVFAVEGFDHGGIHLLLPMTLTAPDGKTHTAYQDNLMPDVVHLAPSEFRLMREETAPYLPAISFLASEFSTTEDDQNAEVMFRVAAVYRLEPWLDPELVELARAQLARQGHVARFMTGVPRGQAKLSLKLKFLNDEQNRTEATVDPASGITDTLDLDHDTFTKLWREGFAQSNAQIRGEVEYQLFDGSTTKVDVSLSLWETSDELFDVMFMGPDTQPGRYKVRIRNRIESPVEIVQLPGEAVAEGVVAHAVDAGSVLNQVLQPQETKEIVYEVNPPATPVTTIEPMVMGEVKPDLNALLKLLIVTPGYSALGFSLTVQAAEGTFQPAPSGGEAITELLVEFDDGTKANLSADTPQVEVSLVGRLIDQILGSADDQQRYFYRVTNIHASGEGARTAWNEGHGTEPLKVGTANGQMDLDF